MIAFAAIAGLQLAGGYFASQNIKETARINQNIADMNAAFAELDAYDSIVEGASEQARYQEVIDQTIGEQQLLQTAQDIDVNYGTAAAKREETKFIGELNLMEIQKQSQERALGYKSESRQIITQSKLDAAGADAKASQVLIGSAANAAQTGISGYRRTR